MNVICNNCGGADFYHLSNEPYNNPFMLSMILADYIFDKRYKKLQENGIQVKFFPYTQGISTTQLREKLNEKPL